MFRESSSNYSRIKLLLIGLTLVMLGPFMFATLSSYTLVLFDRMIAVGGS